MENINEKWTFDEDNGCGIWRANGCFDTKEQAIEAAKEYAIKEGLSSFRIGQCFEVEAVGVDVDFILDNIADNMQSEVGEAAEDYLQYVDKADKEELEEKLNEVLFEWMKEHKYEPSYFRIANEEIHEC